jgi:hypothetical protein
LIGLSKRELCKHKQQYSQAEPEHLRHLGASSYDQDFLMRNVLKGLLAAMQPLQSIPVSFEDTAQSAMPIYVFGSAMSPARAKKGNS